MIAISNLTHARRYYAPDRTEAGCLLRTTRSGTFGLHTRVTHDRVSDLLVYRFDVVGD